MFKLVEAALFGLKKSQRRQFKNYYNEWISALKTTLLPNLLRALASSSPATILSAHVDAVHRHFQSYYEALDTEAGNNLPDLLFPEWRNPLEKPFLWLGDLHPYLFTNLLRSLLDYAESEREEEEDRPDEDASASVRNFREEVLCSYDSKNWPVMMAWKNPSEELMARVDKIECGLRLMVPSLTARARHAQAGLAERVGSEWRRVRREGEGEAEGVGEAVVEVVEEMVGVFMDANRVRSSVLADILSATNIYQAALFYEALSQFLVGFHDQKLLHEFHQRKKKILD